MNFSNMAHEYSEMFFFLNNQEDMHSHQLKRLFFHILILFH